MVRTAQEQYCDCLIKLPKIFRSSNTQQHLSRTSTNDVRFPRSSRKHRAPEEHIVSMATQPEDPPSPSPRVRSPKTQCYFKLTIFDFQLLLHLRVDFLNYQDLCVSFLLSKVEDLANLATCSYQITSDIMIAHAGGQALCMVQILQSPNKDISPTIVPKS